VPEGSLRAIRDRLVADPSIGAADFARAYCDAADGWLASLASDAASGAKGTWALIAVGGYGRGALAPYSDVDLVFLHDGTKGLPSVAERFWYPIWDEGVGLDHSVRTPREALGAARADLRVALGLLDARLVAGDADLARTLSDRIRTAWHDELASSHLDALGVSMAERHARFDDAAFLLEPDLKEARGGLRDAAALHAISRFADRLSDHVDLDSVATAESTIKILRVVLQRTTRRASDRFVLQEHDAVAAALGVATDDLLRSLSASARMVATAIDVAWRRRPRWDPSSSHRPALPHELADGVVEVDGEAALDGKAHVDAELAMVLAATAARASIPIAPESSRVIAAALAVVDGPVTWTAGMTAALIETLRCGQAGVVALETLDVADVLARLIPEWGPVRHFHQRNAYHRFTADRHLLEAAAEAAALADTVIRPDLLVIGALLHDLGKGRGGDHTEIGVSLVGPLATRLGFDDDDVSLLVGMVSLHLLLPDTALRRDLNDPATAAVVASKVGSVELLELLGALAVADGRATGPSAWSSWKAAQVARLVDLTRTELVGGALSSHAPTELQRDAAAASAASGRPVVSVVDDHVVIAAPDQPGLLAAAAGVLCLAGLDVRSVDARTIAGTAVDEFDVVSGPRGVPAPAALEASLAAALDGDLSLAGAIASRARDYARDYRRLGTARSSVVTAVDPDASDRSTVVEVRAPDRVGLLWLLAEVITKNGLVVTAARAVSLGHEAVDVFYLRTLDGAKVHGDALDRLLAELAVVGTPEDPETHAP
jgi:[protein-PII] uridylyltransferase